MSTLLTSLAESAQFGPALKLIHERAFFQSYPDVLQQAISVKDERIREICHQHYSEFLASIDHLMAVKSEMAELKASVKGLNDEVQVSAAQLIQAAASVNDLRRQRMRINEARELVRHAQYLIKLTHKCTTQINKRKFFSAVKVSHTPSIHRTPRSPLSSPRSPFPAVFCDRAQTLDTLQHQHLPRFADYDFAKQLGQHLRSDCAHIASMAVSDQC